MPASATPQVRIEQACARLGRSEVVRRCLRLLAGAAEDAQFIVTLGGEHALHLLGDGIVAGQEYWVRVWAARGLLWAGPGDDIDVLRAALADDSWRVREAVCKVVARHRVEDLLDELAMLESDPVARVRQAARRAAMRIVTRPDAPAEPTNH